MSIVLFGHSFLNLRRCSIRFVKALLICAGLFYLFGTGVFAGQSAFRGKVVGVSDGDTITVMHDGKGEKVRLYGVDCPEKRQAFGQAAKKFTSGVAFGKDVQVEVMTRDRYGRTVGKVTLPDGLSLNHELVRVGLAWWYKRYAPKDAELESLEAEARAARQGLWADRDPVPPWGWRRKR